MTEKRTLKQNKALHKYFEMIAEELNNIGLDVPTVLNNFTMDVMWSKENVKELLWKHAQREMFGKRSTTQLSKQAEIDKIHDVINKFLGEMGVPYIPFPFECDACGEMGKHDDNCPEFG